MRKVDDGEKTVWGEENKDINGAHHAVSSLPPNANRLQYPARATLKTLNWTLCIKLWFSPNIVSCQI